MITCKISQVISAACLRWGLSILALLKKVEDGCKKETSSTITHRETRSAGEVRGVERQDAWFTRLYAQLHPSVLAFAWRRVGPDQAHEVTDETFLIAWRRRENLPEAALPWLLVTARNIIGEQVRKGRRQDAIAAELARCTETTTLVGADEGAIERVTVLTALARLPDRDRDALILTVWDGLNNRQAALVAGCSTATFAVRLHRARRRLAALLEQSDACSPVGGGPDSHAGRGYGWRQTTADRGESPRADHTAAYRSPASFAKRSQRP